MNTVAGRGTDAGPADGGRGPHGGSAAADAVHRTGVGGG
ncbi:hypothetical protein Q760_15280 [Cellulomonas cellasea DSM 20118]|uniref:Uncharacterized protein n=1 Tax=Cellulomonas cellasea DSM 20118 TaxID=1408250 RepID=A0A0A0B5L3_9CELL|nr:hypothetical protein Q760_15280 [Cellulomonas cellasea DSM 20118]